jgi:hypothetical protein
MATNSIALPLTAEYKSPEVAALLDKVKDALQKEDVAAAMKLIDRARVDSPWIRNALGVCLLRLGRFQSALEIFRGMVVTGDLHLRNDVPTTWKTNFASTLLVSNNLAGCISALDEIKQKDHPHVLKLHGAIQRWKGNLTLWQKIKWYSGSEPDQPVPLDFPVGDLD